MASQFGIDFITKPFTDTMVDVRKTTNRATMYALRQTGRQLAKVAKAKAPVYKGSDPRAVAESGNLRRSIKNAKKLDQLGATDFALLVGPFGSRKQGTNVARHGIGVSAGTARAAEMHGVSLASRKYHEGLARSTKGQVRGVPLYRSKMEEMYGYMSAGTAGAQGVIGGIYEEALAKGYAKYR